MIENITQGIGGWIEDRGRARAAAFANRFSGVKSPDQLLAEWKAAYAKLSAYNSENKENAVVNKAIVVGRQAQVDALAEALRAVSPKHPLLQASPHKYADGKIKLNLRLIFEAAFDLELRRIGGSRGLNPKAYRKD